MSGSKPPRCEMVGSAVMKEDNKLSFETVRKLGPNTVSEPEWIRINDAVRVFGLSRPYLFDLISAKKIRSVHITRKGATKGIRLIDTASLRQYIGSFETVD